MSNRRKSSRYIWNTLVIATIVACAAFICISFSFGKSRVSSVQTSQDFTSNSGKLTAETCVPVCDSRECVYHAKNLLDYVNPNAEPCENFFEFACGKMFKKFDPGVFNSQMERYSEEVTNKLKHILDNIEADPNSASGKMKIVYDSCMKYSASEFQALPTVLDFLSFVGIRNWPNLDPDFSFTDISLSYVIAHFLAHQEFGFIEFSTGFEYMDLFEDTDISDSSFKVNSSVFEKSSPYEQRPEPIRKYLVERILSYFNVDPETISVIWEESQAILGAIHNLRKESERMEDEHKNSKEFLDCSLDTFNEWADICQSLESLIDITHAHEKVSKEYAKIQAPSELTEYVLKDIFSLLRNFTDRSVANYLVLNLFINNLDELNLYFRMTNDKVTINLEGPDIAYVKWKKCARWIATRMAFAMGNEYLKTKFGATLLQDVQSIGDECFREATELISRQEWMTEEEKRNVNEEISNTMLNINEISEAVTNETEINQFYTKFHPTEKDFMHNVLKYKEFMRTMEMHGLFTVRDEMFSKNIFLSNAGGGGNEIDIYLGLLVPPTYTPGHQRFMNLMSVGFIFLHEFGHNLENYFASRQQFPQRKFRR